MSQSYEELLSQVRGGRQVTADSRKAAPGCVFVAVRGATEDGTKYVPQAVKAGATAVVADESAPEELLACLKGTGVDLIRHRDTRFALSEMACAQAHTDELPMTIIGITGTNGKTTCAYLLERLFSSLGHKVGVMGTVSYRWPGHTQAAPLTTPDPISLHKNIAEMAKAGCDVCVMECSSHAIDEKRVQHVPFAGACFTNLTQDHLDYHKDMESYFRAKSHLFTDVPRADKAVATNADDVYGVRIAGLAKGCVTYGFGGCPAGVSPEQHLHGELLEQGTSGIRLRMTFRGKSWEFHSPLIGLQRGQSADRPVHGAGSRRGAGKTRCPGRIPRRPRASRTRPQQEGAACLCGLRPYTGRSRERSAGPARCGLPPHRHGLWLRWKPRQAQETAHG